MSLSQRDRRDVRIYQNLHDTKRELPDEVWVDEFEEDLAMAFAAADLAADAESTGDYETIVAELDAEDLT